MAQVRHRKKPTPPPAHRRQTPDPPWLWLALIGGSVAAHGVLFTVALPWLDRSLANPEETGAVAIDLIEIPASDGETAPPQSTSPQPTAPTEPAPIAPAPNQSVPDSDNIALAPQTPEPTIVPSPSPLVEEPSPEPTPTPSETPSEPLPEPEPSNLPPQTPAPSPTPTPTPTPDANPSTSADSSLPLDGNSEGSDELPPLPSITSVPPGSPPSSGTDGDLLGQTLVDRTPVTTELIATVTVDLSPSSSPEPIASETAAYPIRETQPVDLSCLASLDSETAETGQDQGFSEVLGTPVEMEVTIAADGSVAEPRLLPRQQNLSAAYVRVAVCLVEKWEFEPASTNGQPQNSRLTVSIMIVRN
ncbi:MAG: hypothetical protein HC865_23785 [Cyanobacteria bacterium RU_5_0]|nr:hypothetical protein [Cyanobacteria bacterium RU_5_0]